MTIDSQQICKNPSDIAVALHSIKKKVRTQGLRVIDDRRAAEDRAEDAIVSQIAALEAMQARVALAAFDAIESERGARTLYCLAQALTEVSRARAERAKVERLKGEGLEAATGQGGGRTVVETPQDLAAMREALAGKLERLIAQRKIGAECAALRGAQG